MATAQTLRDDAARLDQAAADSFDRCDTDGFLSQWANGITARMKRLQADIEDAGGVYEFAALFDAETGDRVPAKLIPGRYGTCWALCDVAGQFTGQFIGAFPARESTMLRKGYREGAEMAPAKAVIEGSGYGLSGCASAYVRAKRLDGGYPGAPAYDAG